MINTGQSEACIKPQLTTQRLCYYRRYEENSVDTGGCSITPAPGDSSGLVYELTITDLRECGVLVRNGFLSVRVWFPAARGVLTSSDQEVIIMCKPPGVSSQSPVTSGQPPVTREGLSVAGEIGEQQLRYEVSLYRQAAEDEAGDDGGVVR